MIVKFKSAVDIRAGDKITCLDDVATVLQAKPENYVHRHGSVIEGIAIQYQVGERAHWYWARPYEKLEMAA
jgi:hypothetical protein